MNIEKNKSIREQIIAANMEVHSKQQKKVQAAASFPEIAQEIETLQTELKETSNKTEKLMSINQSQRQSNKKATQTVEHLKNELHAQQEAKKKLAEEMESLQLILESRTSMTPETKKKVEEMILQMTNGVTSDLKEAKRMLLHRSNSGSNSDFTVPNTDSSPLAAQQNEVPISSPDPIVAKASQNKESKATPIKDGRTSDPPPAVTVEPVPPSSQVDATVAQTEIKERDIVERLLDGIKITDEDFLKVGGTKRIILAIKKENLSRTPSIQKKMNQRINSIVPEELSFKEKMVLVALQAESRKDEKGDAIS